MPEHVQQEVVVQDYREQPSLIGGKWMAAGPSPASVLGSNWNCLLLEPPGAGAKFFLKKAKILLDTVENKLHTLNMIQGQNSIHGETNDLFPASQDRQNT